MRSDEPTARVTRLVALFDAIVILGTAAAIVMALGARERLSLGPAVLSLRDPARPLLVAAAVALLRFWLARRQPLFPSLRRTSIESDLDAERRNLLQPPDAPRALKYYAAAAMLASLIWITPHVLNIRHVPDHGDPLLSAWRLARVAHQLRYDPANLFDGNIYHPAPYTLTYSDATFLEALVAFPLITAGADPLVVSNVLFVLSFPLSALAFFYTAWRLTSDPQAACVAGILGGLAAFKIEHYSHLELQYFLFAPLALLFLLRMVAAPSWRTGALFGATVTAQWLASMYFGVMLVLFLAPVAILAAVAWRLRPTRALLGAIAVAAAIVLIGGSVTAVPYLRSESVRGERRFDEVSFFSATPENYGDRHRNLATYRPYGDRSQNRAECELFPGSMPLALSAVGILPPASLGTIALMSGTAVAFEASLGANGLIYDELYRYVRPFRGMRVPARFAAFVTTGLILLSAYGVRRLLRAAGTVRRRNIVFALLALAVTVDLRSDVPLYPMPSAIPPIYAGVTPDMVLVEVPVQDKADFHYMYFSTFHGARLINGQSGHFPRDYGVLADEMRQFPTPYLIERLRRKGATHLTVNCRFLQPLECATLLQKLDRVDEIQLVTQGKWQGVDVRLYRFR